MPNIGDAAQSNGDIMRRLRELEAMVRELTAGRRLENASIGKGGLRVREDGTIRSETFDGNLLLGHPGTRGWALGADRLAVDGALVSSTDTDTDHVTEQGFGLTQSMVTRAEIVITPPSWVREGDELNICAWFSITHRNSTTQTDRLMAQLHFVRAGDNGLLGGSTGVLFDDLPGETFGHVSCSGRLAWNAFGDGAESAVKVRGLAGAWLASWAAETDARCQLLTVATYRRV